MNQADDLSLSVVADQAGMSERRFSRHYAQATGQTPARAVERLRARRLLSEKRVSQRCGFGSEETMRRSFLRLLAVTPQKIIATGSDFEFRGLDRATDGPQLKQAARQAQCIRRETITQKDVTKFSSIER